MQRLVLGCLAGLAATTAGFAQTQTENAPPSNPPPAAVQPAPDTGAWRISDKISALDGTHSYVAYVPSDAPVTNELGVPENPALSVSCDHNGFFFSIDWPDIVDGDREAFDVTLTWRLDDGRPRDSDWHFTRHSVVEAGFRGFGWAKTWAGGKTLIVRVPDLHGGQEATFQLAGLDKVLAQLDHINCGGAP